MHASSIRLLCLPHAGASATIYSRWRRSLQPGIDVMPVELPGRGRRIAEALPSGIVSLARQLAVELRHDLGGRYALLGHSLGALVAFELARALRDLSAPDPVALFVSGSEAPSERDSEWYADIETDAQLTAKLLELDGTPAEALGNEELMRMMLPIVRADFRMCSEYRHEVRPRLSCPIWILAGRQDRPSIPALEAWHRETLRPGELTLFDGGHFFVHEHERSVHRLIRNVLGGQQAVGDVQARAPAGPA